MRIIESLNLLNGITTNTSNLFRLLGKKRSQQTNTIVGLLLGYVGLEGKKRGVEVCSRSEQPNQTQKSSKRYKARRTRRDSVTEIFLWRALDFLLFG